MRLVMGSLSQRLQVRIAQKQILTPGLVQLVSVLQLNRLELREKIVQEIAENPVLEESADMIEEIARIHGYERIPAAQPRAAAM